LGADAALHVSVDVCVLVVAGVSACQAEVADILRDAAMKLNAFKDSAKGGGGAAGKGGEAAVKALTERLDKEKAAALGELDAVRKRFAVREREIATEYNEKLTGLRVCVAVHVCVSVRVCVCVCVRVCVCVCERERVCV
jgi:hypothetical protein